MKYFYISFLYILSICSVFGQNYLDYHFKSKGVKGGIVILSDSPVYFATSEEFEGLKSAPPSSLYLMFAYLMVADYFPQPHQNSLKWDGISRSFFNETKEEWNNDTYLKQAFLNKNDWYFQEFMSKIPKQEIQNKLKEIAYTNNEWNDEIPYYWQFGGLLSNPSQHISFLQKLVNKSLPFSKEAQNDLLNLLKISEKEGMKLYGMDAYTIYKGERVEWFIGFFEKFEKRYYFSTRTYFSIENEFQTPDKQQKFIITSEIFDALNLL